MKKTKNNFKKVKTEDVFLFIFELVLYALVIWMGYFIQEYASLYLGSILILIGFISSLYSCTKVFKKSRKKPKLSLSISNDGFINLTAVTRVEVITTTEGRIFTHRKPNPGVDVQIQDGGRTLKVFTTN